MLAMSSTDSPLVSIDRRDAIAAVDHLRRPDPSPKSGSAAGASSLSVIGNRDLHGALDPLPVATTVTVSS